jgi:phosphatidylinositol alpha-1,6-mannosyltransferase
VAELGVGHLVQFVGEVGDEEMVRSYQQCDLFALPNRQIGGDIEGFGIVLLEAQACGKPVIAGDSGGTSETMDIPKTGRVVCCDGPEPLGSTIAEMLANPEELDAMGKRARQWTVDRFDWKVLSKEAEELFASL